MNHVKINSYLLRNVLRQARPVGACSTATAATDLIQKRFYRHGNRVNLKGFYVSPKWFDQKLENENNKLTGILKNEGVVSQVNRIFDEEQERQKSLVTRIEKIEVHLEKPFPNGEDYNLMMNRNVSTPYDCAAHIHSVVQDRSSFAIVDGHKYWHMHQPLEESCHLKLLHPKHPDTMPVNYAFWRSCSMLLASVVKKAFKDEYNVQIKSSPTSDLKGGSFVCDAVISNLDNWNPSESDLRVITSMLWDETRNKHAYERLEVSADLAGKLFANDANRLAYIESQMQRSAKGTFVVYRVDDYIELCDDPIIANTDQIGTIFCSAVHPLKAPNGDQFYRFQGLALPAQLHINAYVLSLLRNRAKQLNQVGLN